jgi:hypothetical protein
MTPLTITKDKYSGKYIAWHLEKEKTIDINSENKSKVFWKCTNAFYLIGVGVTKEQAEINLVKHIIDFTQWLFKNHSELYVEEISSNLPEYRKAIYEYNTKYYKNIENM